MSRVFDDAFILYADDRVLKSAAPASVPPGATGSNGEPTTRQMVGTFDPVAYSHRVVALANAVIERRMEVSSCAFCKKSYTLAEFRLLTLVGYFGTSADGGVRVELRDCGCGANNTIGRVL